MASQAVGILGGRAVLPASAPTMSPHALADQYDRFGSHAYALAVRMLGDHAAAEEVVEAVFLEHWRSAEGATDSQARLLAAVRRHCVTRRSGTADAAWRNQDLDKHARQPEQLAVSAETAEQIDGARLQRAVKALADDQYQALTLAYFDGLNYGQIADKLAVQPANARQLLRRGLESLAALLAPASEA